MNPTSLTRPMRQCGIGCAPLHRNDEAPELSVGIGMGAIGCRRWQTFGQYLDGLGYWPGILSSPEHLVPLCQAAAARGRLYASHVRNRDRHYDLGFGEAISAARQSGARLQISHMQTKVGAPAHAGEHTLALIEAARKIGVDVAFDVIPHDWNNTGVISILPKWVREGGTRATLERLHDAAGIESRFSVRQPRAYPGGIAHVLVNGELAMHDGQRTDHNAGKVLREFKARA